MRIVFWGTYDTGKPRNRILLRGLRENDIDLIECHADIWAGVEDKSQIRTLKGRVFFLFRWLLSYPKLLFSYFRLPRHDVVVVGYLGHLDVLVLWPFARLRRIPIVWDAFLSLYDTVVHDRKIVGKYHPLALLLYVWEWLACRAADCVVLDTRAHADYFVRQFHLSSQKTGAVFVGAESDIFPLVFSKKMAVRDSNQFTILFYGQFIPLHGIETIIYAARLMTDYPVQWIIIGQGQEEGEIRTMLEKQPLTKVTMIPWVRYEELIQWIGKADLCLGIFGDSGKAGRVIPNKVFQILSAGKPLVTRDSLAIRELLTPEMSGVYLIPPADPAALALKVKLLLKSHKTTTMFKYHSDLQLKITPKAVGLHMIRIINKIIV